MNHSGKLVLINSVLSSLPVYQLSILLAPKSFTEKTLKHLKSFLWRGGKGNQKKFHLVNWNVVRRSKKEGGLQIGDPHLSNLAMGGKVV